MNWVDGIILAIVLLLVSLIIFFRYIFPKIKGRKGGDCADCSSGKAGSRLLRDYHHEQKKNAKKKD